MKIFNIKRQVAGEFTPAQKKAIIKLNKLIKNHETKNAVKKAD